MATIKRFEDLEIWQKSREMSKKVYSLTIKGTFAKDFALRDQINASSGSTMDNIAEGFERDGKNEFRQFLSISKASCGEVRSQLYRALDRNHINQNEFDDLYSYTEQIGKQIGNFIVYLNKSEIKGLKFKQPETPNPSNMNHFKPETL